MCLFIGQDSKTKDSACRNKVYKVFWTTTDGRLFNAYLGVIPTEYFIGVEAVSTRSGTELTEREMFLDEVEKGFHCFTNLHYAYIELEEWQEAVVNPDNEFNHEFNICSLLVRYIDGKNVQGSYHLYECAVSPEFHVADGKFQRKSSAVYHKITPTKLIK